MHNYLLTLDLYLAIGIYLFFATTFLIFISLHFASKIAASYRRVEKEGYSIVSNKKILNYGYFLSDWLANIFIFFKSTPSQVTWLSIVLAIVAAFFTTQGLFGIATIIFTLSTLFDVVDGIIARKQNLSSISGEILDSSADRYVDFLMLAGLCIYYHNNLYILSICLLVILGSFMISYSSAKAEIKQVSITSNLMKRAERLLIFLPSLPISSISIAFFESPTETGFYYAYPTILSIIILAVFTNISAVSRLRQVARLSEEKSV